MKELPNTGYNKMRKRTENDGRIMYGLCLLHITEAQHYINYYVGNERSPKNFKPKRKKVHGRAGKKNNIFPVPVRRNNLFAV